MSKVETLTNEVVLDGEPKIHQDRRPSIKLASKPQIVVCIPCGDKEAVEVLTCPKDQGGCGRSWMTPGVRMPNLVPLQLMLAHMNLISPLNVAMSYLAESGRLSAEARQIMTKKALRMETKYILYWDDDTIPPKKGWYTLHNWMERHPEAGAISGVYTTREDPPEPLIYKEHGVGAYWDFPMGEGAEPVPIFGAGAGCLMVRAQAVIDSIERLKLENGGVEKPIWADERTVPTDVKDATQRRIMWGHDIRFCKILNESGWPVYVHGAVLCKHLDIQTGRIYEVPKDAPGFKIQRQRNINTADYWDAVYGEEGVNTWRRYPEMFGRIEDLFEDGSAIMELGCGVGILGSRLVARKRAYYVGYDISPVAVDMARARFLDAYVLDVKNISSDVMTCHNVVATELVEHLDRTVFDHLMAEIDGSNVKRFIFTVPDNCMPPEEVPEHVALFNRRLVRKYVKPYLDRWSLKFLKAGDGVHLICIMERVKNADVGNNAKVQSRNPKKLVRKKSNQPRSSNSHRDVVRKKKKVTQVEFDEKGCTDFETD